MRSVKRGSSSSRLVGGGGEKKKKKTGMLGETSYLVDTWVNQLKSAFTGSYYYDIDLNKNDEKKR